MMPTSLCGDGFGHSGIQPRPSRERLLKLIKVKIFVIVDENQFFISENMVFHFVQVPFIQGDAHKIDAILDEIRIIRKPETKAVFNVDKSFRPGHGHEILAAKMLQDGFGCDGHGHFPPADKIFGQILNRVALLLQEGGDPGLAALQNPKKKEAASPFNPAPGEMFCTVEILY